MLSRNLLSLSICFTFLVNTLVTEICCKSTGYFLSDIKNIVHSVQNMLQCNIFAME